MTVSNESFLAEYSSDDAVRKYSRTTAGAGIQYLLDHEYGPLYMKALRQYLSVSASDGIRVLEFGCGAGMNLIHCLGMLERERIPVAAAIGTDFSKRLIKEAGKEAGALPAKIRKRVEFSVARSEHLIEDMASGLRVDARQLTGSFHLIIGVNTFRYCYRLGKGGECAQTFS